MKYERGMHIIYDVIKKAAVVEFRGGVHFLDGPFPTKREAIRAGEDLCRDLGWGDGSAEWTAKP